MADAVSDFVNQQHRDPDSPYATNRLASRVGVLALVYPAVAVQLGTEVMTALSQAYAAHYDSPHWDINRYGEQFPQLLVAQQYGARASHYDWQALAALAKVEYQLCELYYAESLSVEQLFSMNMSHLEDATEPVPVDLRGWPPGWLESLVQHHPLMDAIPSALHQRTGVLLRCNFRFVALAMPDDRGER